MRRTAHPYFPLPLAQVALASLAGLALRLLFVLRFPLDTVDTGIYEEIARNWINAHVYGLYFPAGLLPTDIRGPGYPAFLGLLYILIGRGRGVILLAQVLLDLCTCFLVADIAWRLAPEAARKRVATAGLWLAATCPLVANYAAVPLTEVLATFLTAAALLFLVSGCARLDELPPGTPVRGALDKSLDKNWFAGALLTGLGTLVRPETPLLLVAFAAVLTARWWRPSDWNKLLRVGLLSFVGLVLPLAPWAMRNWVSLHEIQFLADRYAAAPEELRPRGFYGWTGTWLERFRDVYLVSWRVDGEPIEMADIPVAAFDSPEEKARVAKLVNAYNDNTALTPEIDNAFAALARERTARDPLRTYLFVPLGRMATLWFTPRVELLPVSGHLTPWKQQWQQDRVDFLVTIFFGVLNIFYVALALWGLGRALRWSGTRGRRFATALALLAVFVVIRSAVLTMADTPEPRYVLECFPAILALGALAWLPRTRSDFPGVQDES